MRGIEKGMHVVTLMIVKGAFTKVVGMDGDVDREDWKGVYGSSHWSFQVISRESRHVSNIGRSPTNVWFGRGKRRIARRKK